MVVERGKKKEKKEREKERRRGEKKNKDKNMREVATSASFRPRLGSRLVFQGGGGIELRCDRRKIFKLG